MDRYSILRAAGHSTTISFIVSEAAKKGNELALRFVEDARAKLETLDTIPLEANKMYRTRRGQLVGPILYDGAADLFFLPYPMEGGFWLEWAPDGRLNPDSCPVDDRGHDIVAEVRR